jgi:alkylhydroperoxidase family enzyme
MPSTIQENLRFRYYTEEDAPKEAAPEIARSLKNYGFLPNLHAVLAEAPAAYKAYLDTFALFENHTTFTPLEQQIVFQSANFENNCHYCTPGHTALMHLANMPDDVIEALREGKPIQDKKLEALRTYAHLMCVKSGHLSEKELEEFLSAGYTKRQALEVLVGLASKLISNYTNALAHTELDDIGKPHAWVHPNKRSV